MRKTIVYISLILIFICLPAKTRGQYVKRENVSSANNVAVLYSEGAFPGAIWELGRSLLDKSTNATIRHTVNRGNESNINVNSKLPFRILIAPTDILKPDNKPNEYLPGSLTWSQAMGFTDENNSNLDATATKLKNGCAKYKPDSRFSGFLAMGTGWRVPTQRELQLMWLLREAIDQAFIKGYSGIRDKLSGTYWSSTEEEATKAWYFNFDGPASDPALKTTTYKVRCVRDY